MEKCRECSKLKGDVHKLIYKVDALEQRIININAKYKMQNNEIMLILEARHGKNELDSVSSK